MPSLPITTQITGGANPGSPLLHQASSFVTHKMKAPLRSSRGSGDLAKNLVPSPKQSPIVSCSKQIAASISFPKQLSQFAQSLVIKAVGKSVSNDTKNQLNKSQHNSTLVADKISPRRKPVSETKTAKKQPRVNASTSAFDQK